MAFISPGGGRGFESGPDRYPADRVREQVRKRHGERTAAIGARVVPTDRNTTNVRDGEHLAKDEPEIFHGRAIDRRERDRRELAGVDDIHIDVDPDRSTSRPRDEARCLWVRTVERDPQHSRSVEIGDLAAIERSRSDERDAIVRDLARSDIGRRRVGLRWVRPVGACPCSVADLLRVNWLRVFRSAGASRSGHRRRPPQHTRAVCSEKCGGLRGTAWHKMQVIAGFLARALLLHCPGLEQLSSATSRS